MYKKIKKGLALLLSVTLLAGLFTACNSDHQEVNVICYTEYIPDLTLEKFENSTGIAVNLTTFSSLDEMLAKVKTSPKGTYDFMIGGNVKAFENEGYIEAIDKTKLSNIDNLNPKFLSMPSDPNADYSLPYMISPVVIAVNTDIIKEEITGYNDLLNPAYKDSMVVIEDPRSLVSMANLANGNDMNDRSDEALASAEEYLLELRPNIQAFNGDSPKTMLINGECSLGLVYSAECALAMEENPAIIGVYPEEGVYMDYDRMMIGAEGKNRENAYQFMDYLMDGQVSAGISEVFPYVNPNMDAMNYLDASYTENPVKHIPDSVLERAHPLSELTGEENSKITAIWNRIKD